MDFTKNIKVSLPVLPIIWVVLVIAKVMGLLSWGWFAVLTSIIWIPILIFVLCFLVIVIFGIIAALIGLAVS